MSASTLVARRTETISIWHLRFGLRIFGSLISVNPKSKIQNPKSVLQNACVVDINRLPIAEERDDDPESDGRFGSRDGHHHKYKKLADDIGVISRECDECQVDCVEH